MIWNEQEEKMTPEYDSRIVVALLLVCVKSDDLSNGMVNDDVKDFICGKKLLKIRSK